MFRPARTHWGVPAKAELRDTPVVLDRDVTSQTVSGTAIETTVYIFSVPGKILRTNRMLRWTGTFVYTNNNAASADLTITAKFGGTTLLAAAFSDFPTSASQRSVVYKVWLSNQNSVSAQYGSAEVVVTGAGLSTPAADLPNGAGSLTNAFRYAAVSSAVDTALAQDFVVTVTHDAASANQSITFQVGQLELV